MSDGSGQPKIGLWIGLGLIGLALLLLSQHGCMMAVPWFHWSGNANFPLSVVLPFGFMGLWLAIQIALAVWVGVDADRRGQSGLLWGLLVFFTSVVGLVVYLIAVPMLERNGKSVTAPASPSPEGVACGGCGKPLRPEFKVCPHCGTAAYRRCECGRDLQGEWKVCPYCGRQATA